MPITWTADMNTGIEVIDIQHMRIVDYINALEVANRKQDRGLIGKVLDDCVDYTLSHFAFEESLQEEAGYGFCKPHKRVHELFAARIDEYRRRFRSGEELGGELYDLLSRWLVTHIRKDDADYVSAVKGKIDRIVEKRHAEAGLLKRFFR